MEPDIMNDDFVGRWYPTQLSALQDDLWATGVSDTTQCYEQKMIYM